MTNRPIALVTVVAAAAVIETMLGSKPAPRFVWNVSESVPTGLYQVQPARDLIVTTLVVAYPPEPLATLLEDGGYLPRSVPLIKRILALPGQTVCRTGPTIAVDGTEMGVARQRDHRGRVLPVWEGCRTIASDEAFLMNWDEPASLDGRYFGPIPLHAVVGRAVPLWTFGQRLNRSSRAIAAGSAPVVLNRWACSTSATRGGEPSARLVGAPVLDRCKLLGVLIAVQDANALTVNEADIMDLTTLVTACALAVDPKIMHALIWHQSGGEPWSFMVAGASAAGLSRRERRRRCRTRHLPG